MSQSSTKAVHINSVELGLKRIGNESSSITLKKVIVSTGGEFTLTLYNGAGGDDFILAKIQNPFTGTVFPYEIEVEQGLFYTLITAPTVNGNISVTLVYEEIPQPQSAEKILQDLNEQVLQMNQEMIKKGLTSTTDRVI